jgi:TusA-related sulfurtransferase
MVIRADIELNAGPKTFASGLLVELIAALRRTRPGDLMAVVGSDRKVGPELEAWCRFTRNSLVDITLEDGSYRWVIRCGEPPAQADGEAMAEATVPLALGFGSTRISIATCAVTIAVCVRRRKRHDARSA